MNRSLIYPRPMSMLEYIEWAKTSPDFDKAIYEVIRCESQNAKMPVLLAALRCYEIAAEEIEKHYNVFYLPR